METINRDMRKLTRQYADPTQKASSQQLVAEMQKSTETATTLTPPKAEKMTDPAKTKYLDLYKKDMDTLTAGLSSLKEAVDAGDADKTKAALDKLNQIKMDSHKELGVGGGGGHRGPGGHDHQGPPPGAPFGDDHGPGPAVPPAQASPSPAQP